MTKEIITSRTPSLETVSEDILRLQAQIRMLQSYVVEHIDTSVEDGPNEGNAGPDIIYQCQAANMALDKILDDVCAIDAMPSRKGATPSGKAEQQLQ